MPLLVCPHDHSIMQTVNQSGVELDICPSCRGVWLDPGKLGKLMTTTHDVAVTESSSPLRRVARSYDRRKQRSDRDGNKSRWDDDEYLRRKRVRYFRHLRIASGRH